MSLPVPGGRAAPRRVTRRAALRWGGRAMLGAAAGAACAARPPSATGVRPTGPRLARVAVSWNRIIRRVVGLRPFRPAGFVLRAERMGDQVVVHNYGHGGGGISLSWGTAELAAREAEAAAGRERRAAVLGCGVVGLSTARLLQRRGWTVTLYARDLPPRTTSNVAGGQWTPTSVFDRDAAAPAFVEQFALASRIAYRYYQDFVGAGYGVRWIDNYYLSDEPPGDDWLAGLLPDVFASATELAPHEHPFAASSVQRVRTMLIEPAIYLNALLRDTHVAGGRVVVGELRDRQEVAALPERVVVNCTGLGAAELFGDEQLLPVKGQLTILFPQPEVDYIAIQRGLYMFPRSDGILLGGTFERGDASLDVDPEAERRIVEGHRRLFAGMRTAGAIPARMGHYPG